VRILQHESATDRVNDLSGSSLKRRGESRRCGPRRVADLDVKAMLFG